MLIHHVNGRGIWPFPQSRIEWITFWRDIASQLGLAESGSGRQHPRTVTLPGRSHDIDSPFCSDS
jgi:hypothetical protein